MAPVRFAADPPPSCPRTMAPSAGSGPGTVTTVVVDGELVVRMAGEIDLALRPELDVVIRQVAEHAGRVILDAGDVTFCDGTLPGFLVELHGGGPVSVRAASRLVGEVLTLYRPGRWHLTG